jgi:hypothetical protein
MAMSFRYTIILHIFFDPIPYYHRDIFEPYLFRQDNEDW